MADVRQLYPGLDREQHTTEVHTQRNRYRQQRKCSVDRELARHFSQERPLDCVTSLTYSRVATVPCTVNLTFCSMDPATALPLAPPQRKTTSSAESESSSAHDEDDLSLASDWTNEDERVSHGDGQPRVNDKSPTIDNDVQDSLLVVSTSATDVETLRVTWVFTLLPFTFTHPNRPTLTKFKTTNTKMHNNYIP